MFEFEEGRPNIRYWMAFHAVSEDEHMYFPDRSGDRSEIWRVQAVWVVWVCIFLFQGGVDCRMAVRVGFPVLPSRMLWDPRLPQPLQVDVVSFEKGKEVHEPCRVALAPLRRAANRPVFRARPVTRSPHLPKSPSRRRWSVFMLRRAAPEKTIPEGVGFGLHKAPARPDPSAFQEGRKRVPCEMGSELRRGWAPLRWSSTDNRWVIWAAALSLARKSRDHRPQPSVFRKPVPTHEPWESKPHLNCYYREFWFCQSPPSTCRFAMGGAWGVACFFSTRRVTWESSRCESTPLRPAASCDPGAAGCRLRGRSNQREVMWMFPRGDVSPCWSRDRTCHAASGTSSSRSSGGEVFWMAGLARHCCHVMYSWVS